MDYDDLAAGYARHRRASDAVVAHLVEGGGLCAASVVLEIGCGTANHLAAVCGALAGRGIGVDQSAEMLATARGKMQPGRVVRGRAEALPIADGCVDLAYSVDVVHHLNDVGAYFAEAARVLRPAGRLATVTDSAQTSGPGTRWRRTSPESSRPSWPAIRRSRHCERPPGRPGW